jgi:hypothetical protein
MAELKFDPKEQEKVQHEMGLLPFDHPIAEGDKKPPRDWAVKKGLLKLNRDRSIHYTTHTPWQYQCAFVVHRWPDPEVDPTFVLTEAEFDEMIEAAVAGRTLDHHRECKKQEQAELSKLSEQIDSNNKALTKAVRANTPPDTSA